MPDESKEVIAGKTTDAVDLSDKFQKIGEQIRKVAVDFTTLNVTTLTGNYTHIINTKTNVKTNFSDFKDELGKKGGVDARVKLVAHTHVDFDHDTVNFVSEDVGAADDFIFDIHTTALNSANTSRAAFIRMLKEFVR